MSRASVRVVSHGRESIFVLQIRGQNPTNLGVRIMRPGFFLDNYDNGFIGTITAGVMTHGLKKDSKLGVAVSSPLYLCPTLNHNEGLERRWSCCCCRVQGIRFWREKIYQRLTLQLKNPERYRHKVLVVIGDVLTMSEQHASYERATGRPIPSTPGFMASIVLASNKATRDM